MALSIVSFVPAANESGGVSLGVLGALGALGARSPPGATVAAPGPTLSLNVD